MVSIINNMAGLTLQQLQGMGGTPGQQGQGQTLDQLKNGFPTEKPAEVHRNFWQTLGHAATSFGQGAQDLAVGAAKGAVGTVKSLADTGEGALNAISNAVGVKDKNNMGPSSQVIPQTAYTTKNNTEKVGYGLEQLAEMFVPVGGAEKGVANATERIGTSLPKITDLVKPVLSKAEEQAAKEAGKITTQGVFQKVVSKVTPRELDMAKVAQEAGVNAADSFDKNIAKINKALETHTSQIKSTLEKGKAIFNENEFKGALNKIEPQVMITSDQTLANAYDKVSNKALDMVKNIPEKTKANLFDARIKFDQFVQKQFPNLYKDERLTPMRQAISDIRNAWNDVIAKGSPEYKNILKKENLLFNARESIAQKAPKVGEYAGKATRALNTIKQHPIGAAAAAYGADKLVKKTTGIGF